MGKGPHLSGQRKGSRGQGGRNSSRSRKSPRPTVQQQHWPELASSLDDGDFIVFDIETTGGNPQKNGITEIYALKYRGGQPGDHFYSLVNPGRSIPPIVRRMTGIDNQMVKNAPPISEIMPKFLEFAGRSVLVSHNTIGDMKFLRHYSEKVTKKSFDNFYLCTHLLIEKLFPETPDKSLQGLSKYFNFPGGEFHRAEADAYLTLALFKVLVEALHKKSIPSIAHAIRLQGDLDSGMRLGWGVKSDALTSAPPGPGIYHLYDAERKIIYFSSAVNLGRESRRLQNYSQLPRQLLKIVLRSYDLKFERHPSVFEALLSECEMQRQHRVTQNPQSFHHRVAFGVCLVQEAEGLRVCLGPLTKGTVGAFGPVRDRKAFSTLLSQMAEQLGVPCSRKGFVVDPALEGSLRSFFLGEAKSELKKQDPLGLPILTTLMGLFGKKTPDDRKFLKLFSTLKLPNPLRSLLDESGLVVVSGAEANQWELFSVSRSRPKPVASVKGDWQRKLSEAGLGRRIHDAMVSDLKKKRSKPMTTQEAARANATLWWIVQFNHRYEGRYLTLKELGELVGR